MVGTGRLACPQQKSACGRATVEAKFVFTGSPGSPVTLDFIVLRKPGPCLRSHFQAYHLVIFFLLPLLRHVSIASQQCHESCGAEKQYRTHTRHGCWPQTASPSPCLQMKKLRPLLSKITFQTESGKAWAGLSPCPCPACN